MYSHHPELTLEQFDQIDRRIHEAIGDHGVSVFILTGDDPRMIERWGGEAAPALREAVARERATATS